MDSINTTTVSQTTNTQNTQSTDSTATDDLLLNMVSSLDSTDPANTTNSGDPFQNVRNSYNENLNFAEIENAIFQSGQRLENSSSTFYRDQGTYMKSLAPIFGKLMRAIQNNDAQGVYNALSQALQLAANLKEKRTGNTGYNDLIMKTAAEKNIYQNILNDPNMINLQNPQHAFEFFTQTMMWTQAGSLPDYMYNASLNVGATSVFMDPTAYFPQYNY